MSLYDRAVRRWKPLKNDITTVRRGLEKGNGAQAVCVRGAMSRSMLSSWEQWRGQEVRCVLCHSAERRRVVHKQ